MRLAGRPHADLYIVAEGGEELHQALGRKGPCSSTHEVRDVRLWNAEDLADVAADYGLTTTDVEQAVLYERAA